MLCYILDIVYNFFPNGWVRFAFDVTQPNLDSDGAIYKEINTVIRRESCDMISRAQSVDSCRAISSASLLVALPREVDLNKIGMLL